jgi:hypothetical protein
MENVYTGTCFSLTTCNNLSLHRQSYLTFHTTQVQAIKPKTVRWVGRVTCMSETKHKKYRICLEDLEGKRLGGVSWRIIEIYLRKISCGAAN